MLTTSYVDSAAYKEVVEDGHPILIVTASDIATILRNNALTSHDIGLWLNELDGSDSRLKAYYMKMNKNARIVKS